MDEGTVMRAAAGCVRQDRLLDIARLLLRYPSQIPDEGPVGLALAEAMRGLGYAVQVQPVVRDRFNVIGVIPGKGRGPNIMLNGHLDIPRVVDGWTRSPYDPMVEDGWLYGQGVTDMKGAVAAMVEAGVAVGEAARGAAGTVIVTAVMHHNVSGLGTKFLLASQPWDVVAGINGEPTDLAVQVAHGGSCQFEVETFGVPAHLSRRDEGANAITFAIKLVQRLDDRAFAYEANPKFPDLPRVVVGQVQGGTAASSLADRCVVRGDVRIVPGMTPQTVLRDLERHIAGMQREHPRIRSRSMITANQQPYQFDPASPIAQTLARAHRLVTGNDVRVTHALPVQAYVSDTPDMLKAGIPTVIFGPGDWKMVPDERIRVDDLMTAARVYAATAAAVVTGGL